MGDHNNLNLPPGFHFHPTDEELVVQFLHRKVALLPCHPDLIPDLDLYPYDPWDLDGKAMGAGNKWYFYSRRTQSRITGSGYWQSVGVEEPIYSSGQKVGMKKYNAFYMGEPSQGVKTNWIMQEYRLSDSSSTSRSSSRRSSKINDAMMEGQIWRKYNWNGKKIVIEERNGINNEHEKRKDHSKWVICRVYERNCDSDHDGGTELSCLDEVFLSLDDLDEISLPN